MNADGHRSESVEETNTDRTPSLTDLVVFAPIGFVLKASTVVPELIQAGRAEYQKKAVVAKFLGKMVVEQQRRKRRQVAAARVVTPLEPVDAEHVDAELVDAGRFEVAEPVEAEPAEVVVEVVPEPAVEPAASVELPIDGYDTLPARSILSLLDGLSMAELTRVEAHEHQHRQRATILHRIGQLRSSS
jgi:hypothetical protein